MPARNGKKVRVLLIAEAANPEWTSVPLVGWSHSRAIAAITDAHLVTHVRNRQAILRAGLVEGEDFTAVDSDAVAGWTWRLASLLRGGSGKGWTTVTALSGLAYYYFEHLVWQRFGRQIRQGKFDIVHRLTPLSPTVPSLLASKCRAAGVPFVLGPLNGGVPWPKEFNTARRQEREWLSYVRATHKLLPGYRSTRRDASVILVGSRDTWRQMPREFHPKCMYMPENAIDPARFAIVRQHVATRPIRLIFVGRLVPYKGADMLVEAAAPLVRSGDITLRIVGDGPQMPLLREMVRHGDLESGVEMVGWVDHAQVQQHLAASDVFAFPSIREFGGGVVLEAMATGVVPVVVNYGGPGELVTPETGCLIEMASREQIVGELRAVLADLAARPAVIDAKSLVAKGRARQESTWEAKAGRVLRVYHDLRSRDPNVAYHGGFVAHDYREPIS